MPYLVRALRPVVAGLYVLWLKAMTAHLQAGGFAICSQQSMLCGGLPSTQPLGGNPAASLKRREHGYRGLLTASYIISNSNNRSLLQTSAVGDGGAETAGPILLAERSVNRVTLIGRVGLDPEVRHLPSGDRMASFSLATSEQWRDKSSGEVRSRTEWHRVVVFDKGLVDIVEAFVHKGRRLYVEGSLQTRRWVASDGQERYTTEVLLSKYKGELVLLESPEDKHVGAPTSRATHIDLAQSGAAARTVGGGQALRSNEASSDRHQGGSVARSAMSVSTEATTGIHPHSPWR